jgi:hypothetical protein
MVALHTHNIWGQGPLTDSKGVAIPETDWLAGKPINPAFLRMMAEADTRVTAYADTYNLPDSPLYHAIERAEDAPSLARLPPLQASIDEDRRLAWQRRVETDVDMLEGKAEFLRGRPRLVTAKECLAEIDARETRDLATEGSPVPLLVELRKMNKRELSELLSQVRSHKHTVHPREPQPAPLAAGQGTQSLQLLLAELFNSHSFTSPTRAGAVAGADLATPYDIRRTETLLPEPESMFAKELRIHLTTHDSQSQPATGSAELPLNMRGGPLDTVPLEEMQQATAAQYASSEEANPGSSEEEALE